MNPEVRAVVHRQSVVFRPGLLDGQWHVVFDVAGREQGQWNHRDR
jgi:hypothetical protein